MVHDLHDVLIIITSYNYLKFFQRKKRRCFKLKNVDVEVLLIDDCSTDDSELKVKPFLNDVRFFKTEANSGVAKASNLGLEKSRGRFFIRVDADDFVDEDMSFFLWRYLKYNKDAFGVSCDYVLVDEYEEKIERKYSSQDPISCGIMYRRDLLLDLGGYNDKMRHREEEELRKRLGDYYKIHNLEIPFYRYRMHDCNKTKSKGYERTEV